MSLIYNFLFLIFYFSRRRCRLLLVCALPVGGEGGYGGVGGGHGFAQHAVAQQLGRGGYELGSGFGLVQRLYGACGRAGVPYQRRALRQGQLERVGAGGRV